MQTHKPAHTDRQKDRHKYRKTDRLTYRQADRRTHKQMHAQTDADRQTCIQAFYQKPKHSTRTKPKGLCLISLHRKHA